MILNNLISVETHTATAKFILYAILERAAFEKRNTILMTQVYIAKLCSCTKQGVNKELKYLQEQGYITYKRALYNNLTTTEITLTEKSIALISNPQETQIKPQNKTIKAESRQPQTETEKAPQTAQKQAKTEQADGNNKVKCGCVEEVLELLNYQAERFAEGKQNEFEFRRVARYIVSNNMTISQNIRYVEKNNKFVNFA